MNRSGTAFVNWLGNPRLQPNLPADYSRLDSYANVLRVALNRLPNDIWFGESGRQYCLGDYVRQLISRYQLQTPVSKRNGKGLAGICPAINCVLNELQHFGFTRDYAASTAPSRLTAAREGEFEPNCIWYSATVISCLKRMGLSENRLLVYTAKSHIGLVVATGRKTFIFDPYADSARSNRLDRPFLMKSPLLPRQLKVLRSDAEKPASYQEFIRDVAQVNREDISSLHDIPIAFHSIYSGLTSSMLLHWGSVHLMHRCYPEALAAFHLVHQVDPGNPYLQAQFERFGQYCTRRIQNGLDH